MVSQSDLQKYFAEVADKVKQTQKKTPIQRRLGKNKWSFAHLPMNEQLVIWDYIWSNTTDNWLKLQPYFYCELQLKNEAFLTGTWDTLKSWQDTVYHWWHCDALSKVYTKILERIPDQVLPILEQWNQSDNFWHRRQSIVTLMYYHSTKKVVLPYETMMRLVHPLLNDSEYYVQKGIGWTLRELYNAYPDETLKYLEDNITSISSIAFPAATDKLSKATKEQLKARRK